jgi:hypothetical protein
MGRWIALAALVCVVGTCVGVEQAAAEPQAPKLRGKYETRKDIVRLNWRVRKLDRKAVNIVEIERAQDGAAFESLDAVKHKPARYEDEPTEGGTYWYRTRVHSNDETSGWSNVVSVDVPGAVAPSDPAPGGSGNPPLERDQRECPAGTIDQVLQLTNQARSSNGRGALRANSQLMWAARKRTIDMADSGRLTHNGWVDVINQSGYRWGALAENIALGQPSPASVVSAWMGSSGHRSNILGGYRDIGIGCVIDRNGYYWWTQDFGI